MIACREVLLSHIKLLHLTRSRFKSKRRNQSRQQVYSKFAGNSQEPTQNWHLAPSPPKASALAAIASQARDV